MKKYECNIIFKNMTKLIVLSVKKKDFSYDTKLHTHIVRSYENYVVKKHRMEKKVKFPVG